MFPCFLKRSSASAHPDVHYIWPWLVTFSLLQLFGDWKRYRNLVCWNSVSAPRPSYLAEEWHHSHSDVECSDLHNELKLLDCYYTAITAWNFRWSVCSLTYCLIQSSEGLLAVPLIPTEQIFANSILCIIPLFQGHLNVLPVKNDMQCWLPAF